MYLQYLESRIHSGVLHVHLPNGTCHRFGDGTPEVDWFLHHPGTLKRILRNPARMLGETYLRNEWDTGGGQLPQLLSLLLRNIPGTPRHPLVESWQRLRGHVRRRLHASEAPVDPADFDEWLLTRFLDGDLHYQSGYFQDPDTSLEEAQRTHCRRLMQKLHLHPGQHVLDLNGNWGGLALYLAEQGGVKVTAQVRSYKQLHYAQQRARRRGLSAQVRFLLPDHAETGGHYDRIVAVGILESLPPRQHALQLQWLREMLAPDGLALVQCVGRLGRPGPVNPWLEQHLFPGHHNPALSELARAVEESGLHLRQMDLLRHHYAETLATWQKRFQRHRKAVAHHLGEGFCRLWEFYLAVCEAGFRWRDLALIELQLMRDLDEDTMGLPPAAGEHDAMIPAQQLYTFAPVEHFSPERDRRHH